MKTYESTLVAKYLLSLANSKMKNLNVTKVQKMLYIVYGYYLAKHNHNILNEAPKAWPYGPVFPRTQKKVDYTSVLPLNSPEFEELRNDESLTETINKVIDNYAGFTASQLSQWSHSEGGPWHRATLQPGFNWNNVIPDDYIKSYFSGVSL